MSTAVQELLKSFDRLPDAEKQEAAAEILRRSVDFEFSPLSDEELVASADELFVELDQREAGHE